VREAQLHVAVIGAFSRGGIARHRKEACVLDRTIRRAHISGAAPDA